MKKKILLFGTVMLFCMANMYAQIGGTIGPLTWRMEKISGSYTLFINGTGAMPDFHPIYFIPPWLDDGYGGISCAFTTVIIEEGVTSIGNCAFAGAALANSISIPNTIQRIGSSAFVATGISSFVIPNGVTTIEESTFTHCSRLTDLTLPSTITSFADLILSGCPLTTLTNLNPIPQAINPDVFWRVDISACTLYVPKGSVPFYRRAEVWKEFNIVSGVDIDEIEQESVDGERLSIYPNPTTGACSFVMPDEFLYERFLTLSVYDASGKLIQQIQIDNDGTEKVSLKLDHKAQGVYVVTLSNGRREYVGKVVFN
jgi:hypothetical protein